MKTSLSLTDRIINTLEVIGRQRVLSELRTLSESRLTELGYSRQKLEQGISAWPWRAEAEVEPLPLRESATVAPSSNGNSQLPRVA
ncbi:MAG TPA: hypothetical protein DD979_02955 [Gammaproteobacteria bacterium]|jgi:hypothetical protein|nr:hypothetical protein [Gammaproteobacteria bacterium]